MKIEIAGKKVGLALGGGGVLGAAHIGVIKSLEENKIPIDYISGTSIGALVASVYAFGMPLEKIRKIALDLHWLDISEFSLSQYGLLSNEKIGKMITENLGDVNIEDSKIPLSVIATDISKGEKVVLTKGSLADAVMASTCIPGIFIPITKGNQLLVDGGVVENVPVYSLKEMGAQFTIGVDLTARQTFRKPKNILEIFTNTINLRLKNGTRLQASTADLLISPDLSKFNLYETKQVPDLIEKGYHDSKESMMLLSK